MAFSGLQSGCAMQPGAGTGTEAARLGASVTTALLALLRRLSSCPFCFRLRETAKQIESKQPFAFGNTCIPDGSIINPTLTSW